MSALHTINRSPAYGLLEKSLGILSESDALLLFEDGVYYSTREDLIQTLGKTPVYCLAEDLQARGMVGKSASRIRQVEYRQFVQLCTEYSKVVNWF